MRRTSRHLCIGIPGAAAVLASALLNIPSIGAASQRSGSCHATDEAVSYVANSLLVAGTVQAPWTNETPVQLRSTETVGGISALRADLRQWAPIAFDDNGGVQLDEANYLEFNIRSNVDVPPITVSASTGTSCQLGELVRLKKDNWTRVQLPLSALGVDSSASTAPRSTRGIGRLKFKSTVANEFTVWMSDVRWVHVDESGTAGDGPAPSIPAVTPEPTDDTRSATAASNFHPWRNDPGVRGSVDDHIPARVITLDADGQDQLDDSASFAAAVDAISSGGVIDIPAGTYYLSQPIRLARDNQVLRGAGNDRTRLVFTQSLPYGIGITGQYPQSAPAIVQADKGQREITIGALDSEVTGMYGVITDLGSQHSQIIGIARQLGEGANTQLLLWDPLSSSFTPGSTLQIFDANEFSGVESLSLDVIDDGVRIGDMIHLRSAAHSWVRDVDSRRARESHVFTRQTHRCEITGNTFMDATGHGDGKQGYGVDLANSTTACLIENNTLGYLRHSIVLNASANANIIAFNHSYAPRHTNFAEGGPGDISFHGFAYANLVEGNVVERIHMGDAGAIGGNNLIHRNCLTSGPLTVDNSPSATQSLYSNAMYGSDDQLFTTIMPAVLPETPWPRPYLQAGTTIFDDDGITLGSAAQEPMSIDNWYERARASTQPPTPGSYYGSRYSPLLTTEPTGDWFQDCRIPALLRARTQNSAAR